MSAKVTIRIVLLAIAVGAVIYGFLNRDQWSLAALAEKEAALETYQDNNPWLFFFGYFALYVIAAAFSIPGALILTVIAGRFFGLGLGVLLVSFASTLGATLAFLMSRFVIGDTIREKYGYKLGEINKKLEKEGPFYLFSMRLIPAIPFFVINLLMGLTPIKIWTFWWVSQVGMLAGTTAYVYAGSQFPTLNELAEKGAKGLVNPGLLVAFAILGIFPFAVRKIMSIFSQRKTELNRD